MKTFTLCLAMLAIAGLAKAQDLDNMTVLYSNDFEDETINTGCSIVGEGSFESCSDEGHTGIVYKNGISSTGELRSQYLLLPETVFADFDGQHGYNTLKVTVDVKLREDAKDMFYFYCPLFSAYTQEPHFVTTIVGNELPMLICQSRGVLQVNCYGWSDFTSANNVIGAYVNDEGELVNTETTAWADDGEWHSYEFVISTGTSYVQVDGEIINEWWLDNVSDGQILAGLFTNGSGLVYVCLGGNQAWEWADIDMPYYFDNLVISAGQTALSINEIEAPAAEVVSVEYFNLSGAKVSEPTKGITLEKTTYSDGTTSVNKILK